MKLATVLLCFAIISVVLVEISAGKAEDDTELEAASTEVVKDSLTPGNSGNTPEPEPRKRRKRKHKKKKKWYKTMNNITRHSGKQMAKGLQHISNHTYKKSTNFTNEVYDIFDTLRHNEMPIKKIVSRMPKLIQRLAQDQIFDTIKAMNDYSSNMTSYAQDSFDNVWDFGKIFKFDDRGSLEDDDDDRFPNFLTGFGDVLSDVLDNFFGVFTGRSRDDDD